MIISIIAAVAQNGIIGRNGRIPWNIPSEQERFKRLTTGNIIVMGRRTFEGLGKRLPNRMTLVLSRTKVFTGSNLRTFTSLEDAFAYAEQYAELSEVFIAGGTSIYEETLPLCKKLYITEIQKEYNGDTYFPQFNKSQFRRTVEKTVAGSVPYTYVTYTRTKSITQTDDQR